MLSSFSCLISSTSMAKVGEKLARQLVAAGFPDRRRVRYKEPPEGISQ